MKILIVHHVQIPTMIALIAVTVMMIVPLVVIAMMTALPVVIVMTIAQLVAIVMMIVLLVAIVMIIVDIIVEIVDMTVQHVRIPMILALLPCAYTCGNSATSCSSTCGNSGHTSCVACPTSGLSASEYDINIIVNEVGENIVEVDNIQNATIDNQSKTVGEVVFYSGNKGVNSSTSSLNSKLFTAEVNDTLTWDYICQAESADKAYIKIYKSQDGTTMGGSLKKTFTYSGTSVARWASGSYTISEAGQYYVVVSFTKDSSVHTLSDTFYFKKFYLNRNSKGKKIFLSWVGESGSSYPFNFFIKRI